MRLFRAELVAVALAAASACAVDDGQPWGTVAFATAVSFAPSDGRLDERGRLRTARDYRVEIEAVEVEVADVRLIFETASSAAFDPANPPAGYSLCHNGHCHAADGQLVDYGTIAAELATGDDAAMVVARYGASVLAEPTPTTLATPDCADSCVVPRGTAAAVAIALDAVTVRGRAFDALEGDDARIDEAGLGFEVRSQAVNFVAELDPVVQFEQRDPVDLLLNVDVEITDRLLDDIDFSTLTDEPDVATAALSESLSFSSISLSTRH